ncbi:hypothetical protein F4780DRAFT_787039 [Xylariomycetidae sp. FL0641]|nr:hypothetical protein F4780DRAFT_787039 [Xylariomycetidae sp. FL0641]
MSPLTGYTSDSVAALLDSELVVGIDFGTTYSGVAYAFQSDANRVDVIDSWPHAEGLAEPKVPSTLCYGAHPPSTFEWGLPADIHLKDKIVALKLLLNPDQENHDLGSGDLKAERSKLPKPVVDVAADYLRAIHDHALKDISEATSFDIEQIRKHTKRYVLTVPAIWSDRAKNATQQAARQAGIEPIDMITEPEAAALATLHDLRNLGLEAGDPLVVCDAGGGTVDLIAYEIVNLEPFEVKALTIPSGGPHGSLMLNWAFRNKIRSIVGREAFEDLQHRDLLKDALREFEMFTKRNFRGPQDNPRYVKFPRAGLRDDGSNGLKNDCLAVTGDTLSQIFRPIVQEIEKLVVAQVNDTHSDH